MQWQQLLYNMSAIFAAILDFSKILFSAKILQIFLNLVEKYVFTVSNTNIMTKIREEGNKLKQILSKSYSFRFQTKIYIIIFA